MRALSRLKLPKEHGAWAMLYVPMLAGVLVAGAFPLSVLLLTLSATSVFIGRGPLLAWLRARRRRKESGGLRDLALGYIACAFVFGAPLIFVYRLFWLLVLGLLTIILLWINSALAAQGRDRGVAGEIFAISGLALGAPAAYYAASGRLGTAALWLWVLSVLYFTSSVFYVKMRVLSSNRRRVEAYRGARLYCASYHALLFVGLIALAALGNFNLLILMAFAPALARALFYFVRPMGPLSLKRIGVQEIVYSAIFLILVALTLRPAV